MEISVFWFRRDLRLIDNVALSKALNSGRKVLPIFIFDDKILDELPEDDARLCFIHQCLSEMDQALKQKNSSLLCLKGDPLSVWEQLVNKYPIGEVFFNKDYEPYARERDRQVKEFLEARGIACSSYKDQVILEEDEVLKKDQTPYTVFTPYKNKWLSIFTPEMMAESVSTKPDNFYPEQYIFPTLSEIGFVQSTIKVKPFDLTRLGEYETTRNFPATDGTSYLSPHLRFGSVSVRQIIRQIHPDNATFLSELIWREFFMQILYHFPRVVNQNFRPKYDGIKWRNNPEEFELWCQGKTGYPMVDAGMRQLNTTGYMHNRVRMVVASFLCKHLLIDWRWGEAYFAKKLLDYELSSNNGNWQWAAGTGCDAAPYFRVFNPESQLKKFDSKWEYVRKWAPGCDQPTYTRPMVEHKFARQRALDTYKEGIDLY